MPPSIQFDDLKLVTFIWLEVSTIPIGEVKFIFGGEQTIVCVYLIDYKYCKAIL
jgi:hypothetical protein